MILDTWLLWGLKHIRAGYTPSPHQRDHESPKRDVLVLLVLLIALMAVQNRESGGTMVHHMQRRHHRGWGPPHIQLSWIPGSPRKIRNNSGVKGPRQADLGCGRGIWELWWGDGALPSDLAEATEAGGEHRNKKGKTTVVARQLAYGTGRSRGVSEFFW